MLLFQVAFWYAHPSVGAVEVMKLLVFAHIPPPHHGQSYMVQLMLQGFGGDHRKPLHKRQPPAQAPGEPHARTPADDYGIDLYHVDARLSKRLEEIGDLRVGKFVLLLGYCLQAIWCRFRYGIETF